MTTAVISCPYQRESTTSGYERTDVTPVWMTLTNKRAPRPGRRRAALLALLTRDVEAWEVLQTTPTITRSTACSMRCTWLDSRGYSRPLISSAPRSTVRAPARSVDPLLVSTCGLSSLASPPQGAAWVAQLSRLQLGVLASFWDSSDSYPPYIYGLEIPCL